MACRLSGSVSPLPGTGTASASLTKGQFATGERGAGRGMARPPDAFFIQLIEKIYPGGEGCPQEVHIYKLWGDQWVVWREELMWLAVLYGVVLGLLLLRQIPGAMNRA